MLGSKGRWCGVLAAAWLLVGCSSFRSPPPGFTSSPAPSPAYSKVLTLGTGTEWRFQPLVVDLNRDGHLDLVATARRCGSRWIPRDHCPEWRPEREHHDLETALARAASTRPPV